jgi:glutathione S-transferase
MAYVFVSGNKNYSSWSMRAGLALAWTRAPFTEEIIPLDLPDAAARKAARCPAGRVPVLWDGDLAVWDSLAIVEYLAERHPEAGLWPQPAAARARARSACAEMHSGFQALRTQMPMNIRAEIDLPARDPELLADIRRITALWADCRAQSGGRGPYLFGAWCAADAFYAPVVTRFATYGVDLDEAGSDYVAAVLAHPDVVAWSAAARAEPWTIAKYDAVGG